MAREFYTEIDIEDMAKRGIMSIQVNDNITLTEVAYEKAARLGVKIIQQYEKNPSAPVRPYISNTPTRCECDCSTCSKAGTCSKRNTLPQVQMPGEDLSTRIRTAVISRLGSQVDPVLLDRIIDRVLNNTGVK
jgi:hypothetical protein